MKPTLALLTTLLLAPLAVRAGILEIALVENPTIKEDINTATGAPHRNTPEALSEHHEVTVNGRPVPVHDCRVSAVPFNQVWPGYQRPLDQTEQAGFVCWDMSRPVKVVVQSQRAVQSVVVRPASRGIRPQVEKNRISFRVDRPGPLVVEVNGPQHALHLFANPPKTSPPKPHAPGVRHFGPAVHQAGKITLHSNDTVYLAAGAVVHGSIHASDVSNIRILGRGILDASEFAREEGGGVVRLEDCSDVHIEGIVMRDPDVWCCSLFGCRNITIANVKLIGLWRYNADGIDVCNSQEVEVRDSFVRAFDDALVVKGLTPYSKDPQRGTVRGVSFRDIAVTGAQMPPSSFRGFDAEHAVEGVTIENLRFNGQRLPDASETRLRIGPHVRDLRFVNAAPSGAAAKPPAAPNPPP